MLRRLSTRAALGAAAVAGVLAAPTGFARPAASEAYQIRGVIVARQDGFTSRSFADAKCSIGRNGFTATANALYGAHLRLYVHIHPFSKFETYPLEPGKAGARILQTFISFTDAHHVDFASNFIPPHPVHSLGEINFTHDGQLIGLGFKPMFNASGSEAVIVTGVMECHYPKKKKKH
jgi:hypothetical protein